MENLHSKLQECCYLTQDDKPVISQGSIKIVRSLLKQLRDELYNKATPFEDSSGYIYSKTLFMSEVDEVFNKYLNQKGGK